MFLSGCPSSEKKLNNNNSCCQDPLAILICSITIYNTKSIKRSKKKENGPFNVRLQFKYDNAHSHVSNTDEIVMESILSGVTSPPPTVPALKLMSQACQNDHFVSKAIFICKYLAARSLPFFLLFQDLPFFFISACV